MLLMAACTLPQPSKRRAAEKQQQQPASMQPAQPNTMRVLGSLGQQLVELGAAHGRQVGVASDGGIVVKVVLQQRLRWLS